MTHLSTITRAPDAATSPGTVFDRLRAGGWLSARQHEAAMRLLELWQAAGLGRAATTRWDEQDTGPTREEIGGHGTPREQFRRLMRGLRPGHAAALEAACLGEMPRTFTRVQEGLIVVADEWGIR